MARGVLPIAFTGENEGVPEAGTLSSCQKPVSKSMNGFVKQIMLFQPSYVRYSHRTTRRVSNTRF